MKKSDSYNTSTEWLTSSTTCRTEDRIIPVIYRPFHENTGNWFWWGSPFSTPEEFVALWQKTVTYLRDEKDVHNLLYAYSPFNPWLFGGYGERYPGDDYVDILGFDLYGDFGFEAALVANARQVVELAQEKEKISAITEFGVQAGIQNTLRMNWFMDQFLSPLKEDSLANQVAYALTWRNEATDHHWVPFEGAPNFNSFISFHEDPYSLFLADLPEIGMDCESGTRHQLGK